MSTPLLPDAVWNLVQPMLPSAPRRSKGGRPRVPDRACLTGIIFVLQSGIPWEMLPQELGCGSGMTCWRRLRDWQAAGVWDRLHQKLLGTLAGAEQLDWSRASLDAGLVPALGGRGDRPKPNRSPQIGLEAPSCGRKTRHPARHKTRGGQCARNDP